MKLHVILLFLSVLISLTTATTETICEALEHQPYKDIGLLSITWSRFAWGVLLFTEPPYRFYYLPIDKVTYASMDLSEAKPSNMSQDPFYKTAFSRVQHQKVKAVFSYSLFEFWTLSVYKRKDLFILATDRGAMSGSYTSRNPDHFVDITEPQGIQLPNFTMAGSGYESNTELTGYVLSADSDRFPGIIRLSQYKLTWEGSKVTGLPLPAGQTDNRPFFFLQVMDHPYEVFLVHSSNRPDPEGQLLRSVPCSFLYDKKHLVLFDTVNGCVHVIPNFGGFSFNETKSRIFKRSNYPFEVYFKCGKHLDNPNPNRCNVVRGRHRPTDITPESSETPSTKSVGSLSMDTTTTVTVCLVVAVLAVGLIYAIIAKKKSKLVVFGRSAIKLSASSSAISGKSKRSSKSTVGKSSISGHGVKSKSTLKRSKTSLSK